MYTTMSVSEFNRFCESANPACYIFDTSNQKSKAIHSTIGVVARYKFMFTSLNPNAIFFKNDLSCLYFDRVKSVHVDTENPAIGVVFTIVCGDKKNNSSDISYTMIAEKFSA